MYKQIALAIPALVFALISCKKKEDPKPPKQKEMAEIFSQLSTTPLYASVDMAIGESFHGPKGSRFIISPNSFQTADGTPVTGKVQLKIKELLSKSDMMFNNAYTMSGNGRLISAGELFVEATQNDKPVFLSPDALTRLICLRAFMRTPVTMFLTASSSLHHLKLLFPIQ